MQVLNRWLYELKHLGKGGAETLEMVICLGVGACILLAVWPDLMEAVKSILSSVGDVIGGHTSVYIE